jgi:hypothetical protein
VTASHFVLDHNFPVAAVTLPWPPNLLQVTALRDLDPRLTRGFQDFQIIQALDKRGDVHGLVTNDARILNLSPEMVALSRSRLTLVVTDGVGHDPLRALGLIMVYLQAIALKAVAQSQIFVLKPGQLHSQTPWEKINGIARHRHVHREDIIAEAERAFAAESGQQIDQ